MAVPHDPGVTSAHPSLRLIDISGIARPFGWVSYANYLMLVCCGWSVVGTLVNIRTVPSRGTLVVLIPLILVYGFSAWVGWKNIGTLEAAVRGFTYPAMALLFLVSAGVALSIWPRILDGSAEKDFFVGFAVSALLAAAALLGLLALAILMCMRVPVLGVSLRKFLKQSLALRQNTVVEHRLPPVNPRRGLLYGALGVAWLVGIQLVPDSLVPDAIQRFLWQIAQVGYGFLIHARQYFQPDFATVRAADRRPPVVFLRSFSDDEKINYQKADRALFDFSLESRLAGYFSAIGPFIAVASPHDELPQFGAARAHLSDAEWQTTIISWLDESSQVILMAGFTEWVEWELKKVIVLSHVGKLIVILPQVKKRFWQRDETSWARIAAVRRAFAATPWEPALAQLLKRDQTGRVRSITFHADGGVTAVLSKTRNRESFHLAAIIAYQLQQQDRGHVPAFPPVNWKSRILWWSAAVILLALAAISQIGRGSLRLGPLMADPLEPIPPAIPVTSTGRLQAGNLTFGNHTRPVPFPTYRPGEKLELQYEIARFGTDSSGLANVEIDTTLLDSDGLPESNKEHHSFHAKADRIRSSYSLQFSPRAAPGDYFIDVKLHDAVENSDLEFKPTVHLDPAH